MAVTTNLSGSRQTCSSRQEKKLDIKGDNDLDLAGDLRRRPRQYEALLSATDHNRALFDSIVGLDSNCRKSRFLAPGPQPEACMTEKGGMDKTGSV